MPRDESVERVAQFDYDEWLESVEGETVKVTMADGLGAQASKLVSRMAATHGSMTLCPKCEDMRLLIDDGDVIGKCPVCGHHPRSMLALGTQSKSDWDNFPEEEKPDV